MADYIITSSKIHFTPLQPREEDIRIQDIAHALSLMTRANGHFPEFYSVAQHSIHCAEEAIAREYSNRVILACLLHDASESYLADITRPVKRNLKRYLEVEEVLQNVIFHKYLVRPLTREENDMVSSVDDALLYYEFYHYMEVELFETAPTIHSQPEFGTQGFREVEERFLELFLELFQGTLVPWS